MRASSTNAIAAWTVANVNAVLISMVAALGRPGRRGFVVEQAVAAAEAAEIVFEPRGSAGLRAPVYHRHAVHGFAAERQDVRRTCDESIPSSFFARDSRPAVTAY
jgi:hypothetical protein